MGFDFGKLIVDGDDYGSVTVIYEKDGQTISHIETFPTNLLGAGRYTLGQLMSLGNDIELRLNTK